MAANSDSFSSIEFLREGFPDPFELQYIIGFNKNIGVKHYFNKKREDCVVYNMSNVLSIYNLHTKTFQNVLGHHEQILNFDIDKNNKIMVSSDKFAALIWDLRPSRADIPILLRKIEHPFGIDKLILATGISRCGKYLIMATTFNILRKNRVSLTIGENKNETDKNIQKLPQTEHMIQFWEWACSRKIADDRYRLLEDIGSVKSITFSESNLNFFAVTYTSMVLFGILNKVKNDIIEMSIFVPERLKYKNLKMSCFLSNSSYLVTSARGGDILVWTESSTKHYNNEKKYLKTLKTGFEINDIKCFDNFLVIADDKGEISFLNYDLRIMYKCSSKETGADGILSVSPVANKREYKLWEPNDIISPQEQHVELIPLINCPLDFTDNSQPIVIRKFFFISSTGQLYLHDPVYKKTKGFLVQSDDIHIAFDVFPKKPWILICTRDGHVRYFNNVNEMEVSNYYFAPVKKESPFLDDVNLETNDRLRISACRISDNEEFVAIGFENGDLCMIDPITANPISRKLMNFAPEKITNIYFSPENDRLCCYADEKHTTICIQYDAERRTWYSLGKFRYHCDHILSIFFTSLQDKNYLLTIGADRMYVKYALTTHSLVHKMDKRLEQTAKPTAAILLDTSFLVHDTSKYKKVILTANNQYKIVIYDAFTADNLFTFLGPVYESPIKIIIHLDQTVVDYEEYLIFASDRTLGACLCPISGNPFRYSGIYAHYKNIKQVKVEIHNFMHFFVLGDDNAGECYWKINKQNIRKKYEFGGVGLEPFCKLLPGGKSGWLFKEIQDYFFYIQLIANASDAPEKNNVCDYITTSDIATFMQAIGYFPSDFEIKNLTNEFIRVHGSFEAPPKLISFSQLLRLYINHRPVDGYKLNDMKNALAYITQPNTVYNSNSLISLNLRTLLELLTNRGEAIPRLLAMRYIKELLEPEGKFLSEKLTEIEVFNQFKKLPRKFDFLDFCDKLLGVPIISKNKPNHHFISVFQGKDDPSIFVPELENRVPLIISAGDEDFVEIMSNASDQRRSDPPEPYAAGRKSRLPF